jgi:hypothetical protein
MAATPWQSPVTQPLVDDVNQIEVGKQLPDGSAGNVAGDQLVPPFVLANTSPLASTAHSREEVNANIGSGPSDTALGRIPAAQSAPPSVVIANVDARTYW